MRNMLTLNVCFFGSAVLLLAGCTASGGTGAEDGVSAADWESTASLLWKNADVLLSATRVESEVALAYVAMGDGNEFVVARDARTGREFWRQQAIPGINAAGVEHQVAIVEDGNTQTTAFLVPTDDSQNHIWGTLSVVDVATGTALSPSLSSQSVWSSRPKECIDTFCITGRVEGQDKNGLLMYRSEEGGSLSVAQGAGIPYLDGGRFLGNFVSSSTTTGLERLNFGENGRITWSRPYTDVFGEGTSSDGGWAWIDDELDIPLVGVGYTYTDQDLSKPFDGEYDMTETRLVGLDRDTGATIWQHDGLVPCPGLGSDMTYSDGIVVACRVNSGTQAFHWDGTQATEVHYSNTDVDLVGVNPESGEITWDLALGSDLANVASASWGGRAFAVGDVPIVTLDGTASVVDRATGAAEPVPARAVLLCAQKLEKVPLLGAWNDGKSFKYPAATVFAPCSPTGEILEDGTVSVGTLAASGYDTSVINIVNLSSGVTAFAPKKP
ncbi:hypothetical protein GCM10022381_13120 [Leifsonia kafniensis]|uniref:Pyrrolo-quinoline quinone n=1 Tax=Leifsonia kafniensis TaxID=475957 RepID=A0ABP7KAZ8_9MICO